MSDEVELNELFAYNGTVEELEFDDVLRNHLIERGTFDKHIVTLVEISEAHSIAPVYFVNESPGGAPVALIGQTRANRILCVPIDPTGRRGVWRPRTAFEANTHHKVRYEEEQHG